MTWRWAVLSGAVALWLNCAQLTGGFSPVLVQHPSATTSSSSLHMAMNRKARRQQKKEKQGTARLRDLVEEDAPSSIPGKQRKKGETMEDDVYEGKGGDADAPAPKKPTAVESVTGGATTADAIVKAFEERPEVSKIVIDDETGFERIEQGQAVMDVITRKAVKLSDMGPMYRLAQMFPGVPPEIRDAHRFDWKTVEVPEMIERLKEGCSIDGDIPPHPSVANKGIDFVLANRDYLGFNMKRTLTRLMLREQSLGNVEKAKEMRQLAKHFYLMENHISAPFRQMILDAEGRIGPNFGNLDLKTYTGKDLYERTADYLVLKGMVTHWAKKYSDAEFFENTPQKRDNFMTILSVGDPKRYLPNNQVIFRKKECEQILAMALKLCNMFVDTPELWEDLPPEVRFIEVGSKMQDGTSLRKFVVEDFCPSEGIEPAGLREGMRRLLVQLDNMQVDPYADIRNMVDRLSSGIDKGSDDERDPYFPYLCGDPGTPGHFETYTFDAPKESIIRFLDGFLDEPDDLAAPDAGEVAKGVSSMFDFSDVFGLPEQEKSIMEEMEERKEAESSSTYKVPEERACGRPHMAGWLDLLKEDTKPPKISEGTVVFDESSSTAGAKLESENWQEVE